MILYIEKTTMASNLIKSIPTDPTKNNPPLMSILQKLIFISAFCLSFRFCRNIIIALTYSTLDEICSIITPIASYKFIDHSIQHRFSAAYEGEYHRLRRFPFQIQPHYRL